MKTEIFKSAIRNRNRLIFLYGLDEIQIEPYYITIEKNGGKFHPSTAGVEDLISYFDSHILEKIKLRNGFYNLKTEKAELKNELYFSKIKKWYRPN